MKLILASASPRRRELLSTAGYEYSICAPDIDESVFSSLSPERTVLELSRAKAIHVAENNSGCVVLGCDTIVALEGKILGKPSNAQDAFSMLKSLSGRTHTVYTGVSVVLDGDCKSFVSATKVTFFELSDSQIQNYVDTGEPMDKAGAYGIQGLGSVLVEKIDGDYFTVVGLPVAECARVLACFGVSGKIIEKL